MKIIVGLGNFGDKYAYTYHNLGFLTAEAICDRLKLSFKKRECDASVAKGFVGGDTVIIAKPLTYMNLSGLSVLQLLKKNKAALSDLLVIYDDVDIEKGKIRVRTAGSAGTHNGMRNIIERIGSGDFMRIRIGIGRPDRGDLADYVLSEIPLSDRPLFKDAIEAAATEAEKFIKMND